MPSFDTLLEQYHIGTTLRAALLLLIGFFAARLLSLSISRALNKRLTRQQSMLLQRFIFYFILSLFVASAIQQLGFNIGTLLGATGILTVAIGIASQTSFSNIISGIFIIGEKPFEIGNTIRIGEIEGEVLSIDLLSVKIRTADNMMIRVPNETLIKSAITNISYFPKRRIDLKLCVAYKENIDHVKQTLFTIAEKNSLCLKDPHPQFTIIGFGETITNIRFCVWATREDFDAAKTSVQEDIKTTFSHVGIEISPSRSLYSNNASEPLSIKIIS